MVKIEMVEGAKNILEQKSPFNAGNLSLFSSENPDVETYIQASVGGATPEGNPVINELLGRAADVDPATARMLARVTRMGDVVSRSGKMKIKAKVSKLRVHTGTNTVLDTLIATIALRLAIWLHALKARRLEKLMWRWLMLLRRKVKLNRVKINRQNLKKRKLEGFTMQPTCESDPGDNDDESVAESSNKDLNLRQASD